MKILSVTSSSNGYFRKVRSLLQSKGIKSEGLALISGAKIVGEILKNPKLKSSCQELIIDEGSRSEGLDFANAHGWDRVAQLSSPLFKELDEMGSHFPLLVCALPALKLYEKPIEGLNVFLALSDPLNLGAALRSLEAFRASQVVLLKECAHVFLPKVTKTSSGSNLRVPLVAGPGLKDLHLENGIGLDGDGRSLNDFTWPKNACLVLGEEGQGLPEALKSQLDVCSIPINPQVESLNATVALSIACYSYRLQHAASAEGPLTIV